MTPTTNRLAAFLNPVVAGALAGQVATERGIPYSELISHNDQLAPRSREILQELTALGIDTQAVALLCLHSLVGVLNHQENVELIIPQITQLLWTMLGDPKNGGEPPIIYRRAAAAMYMAFLGILEPDFIDPPAQ